MKLAELKEQVADLIYQLDEGEPYPTYEDLIEAVPEMCRFHRKPRKDFLADAIMDAEFENSVLASIGRPKRKYLNLKIRLSE